MLPNFHSWRFSTVSSREHRLAFGVEDGNKPQQEVVENKPEAQETHTDVVEQMKKYKSSTKDAQEKMKTSVDNAVLAHEVALNEHLDSKMGTYMESDELKSMDATKQGAALEAKYKEVAEGMASNFNKHTVGQDILATVIPDADGVPKLKLTHGPATAPVQKTDKPADGSKDAGTEKGKKELGEKKGTPDQKNLDATMAKLNANSQKVLNGLPPADKVVALRAFGNMPQDLPRIEALLANGVFAKQAANFIKDSARVAVMSPAALATLMKTTPADADVLVRLAQNLEKAKLAPAPTPTPEKKELGEPKTEAERLQRQLSAQMAELLDVTKTPGDRIVAALSMMATLSEMMQGLKDLSLTGPPKLSSKPGTPDATGKAPNTLSSGPSTGAAREQLKAKATAKGANSLREYRDKLKTEEPAAKISLEDSKARLATAEIDENRSKDSVATLEKQIVEKGSDERAVILLKDELRKEKGKLTTATESVKQAKEEVQKNEAKYKEISADLKEINKIASDADDLATKMASDTKILSQAIQGADVNWPDYAKELQPFMQWDKFSADPSNFDVKLEYPNTNARANGLGALRTVAAKAGMQPENVGIDGNGIITDPELFKTTLQKVSQYLRAQGEKAKGPNRPTTPSTDTTPLSPSPRPTPTTTTVDASETGTKIEMTDVQRKALADLNQTIVSKTNGLPLTQYKWNPADGTITISGIKPEAFEATLETHQKLVPEGGKFDMDQGTMTFKPTETWWKEAQKASSGGTQSREATFYWSNQDPTLYFRRNVVNAVGSWLNS